MTSASKDPALIDEIKNSHVAVPWCDEFEKMVSGMKSERAGNSQDMLDYKLTVMEKVQRLNDETIHPGDSLKSISARCMAVGKDIFGNFGQDVKIDIGFFGTWGCNVYIGDKANIKRGVSIYDNAMVKIGDRTLIGPDVSICTGTHPVDMRAREEFRGTSYAQPIIIEAHCWIGTRAVILPGVRVGRGTTVAAGAVVTKDVEPASLVGGVPAKLIKKLGRVSGSGTLELHHMVAES